MDDEKLIEKVREHPCLYNTKLADYKVLLKKENAWKNISEALGPGISVNDCMKRWKALRERFARESNRKKKKSGDPIDDTPEWSLYNLLLFLKEFIKHRKTSGNMEDPIVVEAVDEEGPPDLDDEESIASDILSPKDSSCAPSPSVSHAGSSGSRKNSSSRPSSKKRRTASEDIDAEILRQLAQDNKIEDEESLFGQSLAASLRKLDPRKKSLAKIRLQQVLYEIEFAAPIPFPGQLPPPVSSGFGTPLTPSVQDTPDYNALSMTSSYPPTACSDYGGL